MHELEDQLVLGEHRRYGSMILLKHAWERNRHWNFGQVQSSRHPNFTLHFPSKEPFLSSILDVLDNHGISHHFENTWISQEQWWTLEEIFVSAKHLKVAAEIYDTGPIDDSSKLADFKRFVDPELAKRINHDLGRILDQTWELLHNWKSNFKNAKKPRNLADAREPR